MVVSLNLALDSGWILSHLFAVKYAVLFEKDAAMANLKTV